MYVDGLLCDKKDFHNPQSHLFMYILLGLVMDMIRDITSHEYIA